MNLRYALRLVAQKAVFVNRLYDTHDEALAAAKALRTDKCQIEIHPVYEGWIWSGALDGFKSRKEVLGPSEYTDKTPEKHAPAQANQPRT
jgi:hypothetical protein